MTKREIVWLLIRLIGIYLIYLAVTGSINLIGSFITAWQTPGLIERSFVMFLLTFFLIVLESIAGIYLLNDGTILFDILDREEKDDDPDQDSISIL